MKVCRGEIWLVNLNPVKKNNEMGKVRPALVFQNNALNHSPYPTTIIIPLSSQLVCDSQPIRYKIGKREDLEQDSDLVLTQVRAVDNARFVKKLATVTAKEMQEVKKLFDEITT
ncbi:MAG: type II toxin-antitoxin system PemK/MazF family toxin [Campylobacterota bacterium]